MDNISIHVAILSLRIATLGDLVFGLPWSFGGRCRLDRVWTKVTMAMYLMQDYESNRRKEE